MAKTEPVPRSLADFLFTLPFIALFLVQLAHHQMWRDEVNVFAIGQESPSFASLLYHVHYEGHPWLWYTLVWLLTKATSNPDWIKLFPAVTGVAVYAIIGMASPFRRVEKLLLFLSYFVLFEYAVFARMYGLQLLFVLLYLRGRSLHPQRVVANSLLLGLAASLDMTGIILSFALACEYLWTLSAKPAILPARRIWAGAAVYAALLLFSIETLYPTRDLSLAPHKFTMQGKPLFFVVVLMDYVARPFLPTLRWNDTYWNPQLTGAILWLLLSVPLVLAAFWATFRRHAHLLLILAITLTGAMAFGMLFYLGFTRHFGITFVAFLACLWLLRASGASVSWPAYALLACTALSGIDADIQSWRVPFSNAKLAAAYLEDPRWMSLSWAGYQDFSVATLSTYTGRPIYQLNCFCTESFFFLARQRDAFEDGPMVPALDRAFHALDKPEILYIGDVPLKPAELAGLAARGYRVRLLRSFTGAAEPLEDYYIYDMQELPPR